MKKSAGDQTHQAIKEVSPVAPHCEPAEDRNNRPVDPVVVRLRALAAQAWELY